MYQFARPRLPLLTPILWVIALSDPLNAGSDVPLGSMPLPQSIYSVAVPGATHTWSSQAPLASAALHQLPVLPTLATTSRRGLILSPAADPIPHRLVQRIQAGEFVEMRDLLADNVSLHGQLEDIHGPAPLAATPLPFRPRLREVPSLQSWMYCFIAYVAVRSTDQLTRDLLAYGRLIIREALRHGGNGWQEYDRSFRRQAAIDSSIQWNTLLPGLQAATLVGSGGGTGVFCTICREPDHSAPQCALASVQQPILAPSPGWPSYRPPVPANPVTAFRRPVRPPRRPETGLVICASWNRGSCSFPGTCTYRHICSSCQLTHKRIECPTARRGPVTTTSG